MEVDKGYQESLIGVPQGGILSPILSNLYLTPFDEYVDTLKEKYNKLPISGRNPEYRKYESIIGNHRNHTSLHRPGATAPQIGSAPHRGRP